MFKSLIKIAMMLVVASNVLLGQFSGGAGTEASPYLIKTKADLMNIRDSFAVDKHYKLCNNIRDSLREPIPYFENSTFDGQGYKITLAIKNHSGNVGLFAETKNVILRNIVVDGYIIKSNASGWAGGIIGTAYEVIEIHNCVNLSNITSKSVCCGGIIGHVSNEVNMKNCINLGNIKYLEPEIISKDEVKGEGMAFGGLIGHCEDFSSTGNVTNNVNAGFVSANSYIAGIIGMYGWVTYYPSYVEVINNINVGVIRLMQNINLQPIFKDVINGITNYKP